MRPYMKPMLRRAFCLIDAVIVFISYILVDFLLENHGEAAVHANFVVFNSRFFAIFIAAVVNIIVQWILGCYRVLWRSSSIRDYSICALGAFLSAVALLIGSLLVHGSRFFFPWDVQIIAGLFIAFGFVITRLVLRNVVRIYVRKRQDKTHKAREVRMLLVGAGGGAIRIISEVLSGGAVAAGPYHPAFGEMVMGERFYRAMLPRLPQDGRACEIIVPPRMLSIAIGQKKRNLRRFAERADVRIIRAEAGCTAPFVHML